MRKAQLQIMQSTMILLLLFIILGIAFIFFMYGQRSSVKEKMDKYTDMGLSKRAKILNYMPELLCSSSNVLSYDCFDIDKIAAFSDVFSSYESYYVSLIGPGRIKLMLFDSKTLSWSDPDGNSIDFQGPDGYVLYDNPKPNYKESRRINIPISIYNATENKHYFGVMEAEFYR